MEESTEDLELSLDPVEEMELETESEEVVEIIEDEPLMEESTEDLELSLEAVEETSESDSLVEDIEDLDAGFDSQLVEEANSDSIEFADFAEDVKNIEEKREVSAAPTIDIQATMEGFVNTLEPENLAVDSKRPDIEDDSLIEAISEEEAVPSVSNVEIESSEPEVAQVEELPVEEIDGLYQAPAEEETPVAFRKTKKSNGGILAALMLLVLVAGGVYAFLNKDSILEMFNSNSSVESVPNELATPAENTIAQQMKVQAKKKEKEVAKETEKILNDIEEPVQLMDTSVSVAALTIDCDAPVYMLNPQSRRYLLKLAKRLQLQLRNALLIAGDIPLANKVVFDISVTDDNVKFERISGESGSKKVDDIVTNTAKTVLEATQPYSGTFDKNNGNIRLIVRF